MSVLFISYHNSRNTLFFFSRLAGSRLHPGVASGWAQFCSTAGTLRRRGSFQFSHRNYPQYIKAIAKLRRGRFWGMGIRGTLEEQRGGGGQRIYDYHYPSGIGFPQRPFPLRSHIFGGWSRICTSTFYHYEIFSSLPRWYRIGWTRPEPVASRFLLLLLILSRFIPSPIFRSSHHITYRRLPTYPETPTLCVISLVEALLHYSKFDQDCL